MGIKLAKVDVKAYRSIASDGFALELGSGMNALVGPNNVGKSNVMRAIALGFGEASTASSWNATPLPISSGRAPP